MNQIDIRESFLLFPSWSQNFWTWFTGKALPGQQPLVRLSWKAYLGLTLGTFFLGLSISTYALAFHGVLWIATLLLGLGCTLTSARVMILVIAHQCVHLQFSGRHRTDMTIGEIVTLLAVYEDGRTFRVEHFDAHHRADVFATTEDPPVQLLLGLGFRPGMSRAALWLNFFKVVFSPLFYLRGFARRIRCNVASGGWRRAGFALWIGYWASVPFWMAHGWQVLTVGFVLPVIVLAQVSALLDKLGEHAWLTLPDPTHGRRHYHVAASWARYTGRAVPDGSTQGLARVLAWGRWTAAMTFYHLPSRLFVVVGDLPNHDFHHRYPGTKDWMVSAYARQRDIDFAPADQPAYKEIWGMFQAVDQMFDALRDAPPEDEVGPAAMTVGSAMPQPRGA